MNSLSLLKNQYEPPPLFAFHLLLLPVVPLLLIFIYYNDQNMVNVILLSIILAYSLIIFILGYATLNTNKNSLVALLGIIFGFINTIYSLYLLFLYKESEVLLATENFVFGMQCIKPYLGAVAALFVCKFFGTELNLKTLISSLIIGTVIVSGTIFIFHLKNPMSHLTTLGIYYHDYIKISVLIIAYFLSTSLLWKRIKSIPRSISIPISVFFIFITIGETLSIFNYSYIAQSLSYISIVFALWILYSTQLKHAMIDPYHFLSKKQYLYSMNTSITNEHLKFKDLELQFLRDKVDAKTKFYTKILDFAPDAFVISIDHKVVYVNQTTLKLLNAPSLEEVLNRPIWDFMHPDSIPLSKLRGEILSSTESSPLVNEFKMISLDGEIKHVEISSNSIFFDNKYYIISCIRDLSNIKAQERIKSELEADISRERFKVEFFTNISHDLKTPINVIYSATQLQDICFKSNELEKVHMYNNIIKQNCLRLQKLLNDLLDITKIDTNHFVPHLRPCDIIYLIESITQSVTTYVEHKNLSIIFDTNIEEKITMTDSDLIERVVLNLLSNAIKYGKPNGHIWITLNFQDDFLTISVKDDGIGIPKDQIPLIFERFLKAKNNTTHCLDGAGIGLSLVRAIVEMLGGTISCKSKEGRGSEFIVVLPMMPYDIDSYIHYEHAISFERDDILNIELSDI